MRRTSCAKRWSELSPSDVTICRGVRRLAWRRRPRSLRLVTDVRTQKQRMLAGDLYSPVDPEIMADHEAAVAWMGRYKALDLPPSERHAVLRELLAEVGDRVSIRPPFHCDYGYNIS